MLLRVGVRHNSCETILTAEGKLIDMFFVGNHPVYREIMFDYIKSEKFMPKEVLHTSFAVSTVMNKSLRPLEIITNF